MVRASDIFGSGTDWLYNNQSWVGVPPFGGLNTSITSPTQDFAVPILVPRAATVDAFVFDTLTTGFVNRTISLFNVDSTSLVLGSLVVEVTGINTGASARITVTFPSFVLSPGQYYIVLGSGTGSIVAVASDITVPESTLFGEQGGPEYITDVLQRPAGSYEVVGAVTPGAALTVPINQLFQRRPFIRLRTI